MKYKLNLYSCGDPQDSCLALEVLDENGKQVYDTGYVLDWGDTFTGKELIKINEFGFNLDSNSIIEWELEDLEGYV